MSKDPSRGSMGWKHANIEIFPTDTSRLDGEHRQRHAEEFVWTFHPQDKRLDPFTRKLIRDAWTKIHGTPRLEVTDQVYGVDL